MNYVDRLASNSEITCFCLPSADGKGVCHHHAQPKPSVFEAVSYYVAQAGLRLLYGPSWPQSLGPPVLVS